MAIRAGWVRVNHPIREEFLVLGPFDELRAPRRKLRVSSHRGGDKRLRLRHDVVGRRERCCPEPTTPAGRRPADSRWRRGPLTSAVSHRCAMISGQKKNRRSRRSMKSTGFVSGNPGASAMVNGLDQPRFERFQRAPLMSTSSAVRSPDPWNQHTSRSLVGELDNRRRVVVPGLEREDELAGALGLGSRRDRQRDDRSKDSESTTRRDP